MLLLALRTHDREGTYSRGVFPGDLCGEGGTALGATTILAGQAPRPWSTDARAWLWVASTIAHSMGAVTQRTVRARAGHCLTVRLPPAGLPPHSFRRLDEIPSPRARSPPRPRQAARRQP